VNGQLCNTLLARSVVAHRVADGHLEGIARIGPAYPDGEQCAMCPGDSPVLVGKEMIQPGQGPTRSRHAMLALQEPDQGDYSGCWIGPVPGYIRTIAMPILAGLSMHDARWPEEE